MTYEEAIKWFGDHMLKVMKENGYKDPIPVDHLFQNMNGEMLELHTELCKDKLSNKKVIKESVDVANYAMMIALNSIGIQLEAIRETELTDTWPSYRYGG